MNRLIAFFVVSLVILGSAYGLYKLVGSGEFMDWLVGSLSLIWMFFVVTIPWNAYFKAREIIFEAEVSSLKNINFREEGLKFAKNVGKRSLIVSILLHVFSALGLFLVAYFQISQVGYYSAVLILLLTFLRPGIRFYEYLYKKLEMIRQEIHFPRDDLQTLKDKVDFSYSTLDTNPDNYSWRQEVDKSLYDILQKLEGLEQKLTEVNINFKEREMKIEKELKREMESIRKESQESITKIVEHGEVTQSLSVLAKYLKKL